MIQIIIIAILGFLGWLAQKWIFQLWNNFQILRLLNQDVYGVVPMSKIHFLFIVLLWILLILCIWIPPLFALVLICIALSMKNVFARSSPEIAYRLLYYTFLMALVIVFTLIGFVAFLFAMVSRRDSINNQRIAQLQQIQMMHDRNAINRVI